MKHRNIKTIIFHNFKYLCIQNHFCALLFHFCRFTDSEMCWLFAKEVYVTWNSIKLASDFPNDFRTENDL